jgi:DNA replication protein DnaC
LLSEIKLARADGSYLSFLKKLIKIKILILDDFSVAPMDAQDAQELLEVIEDRVTIASMIILIITQSLMQRKLTLISILSLQLKYIG